MVNLLTSILASYPGHRILILLRRQPYTFLHQLYSWRCKEQSPGNKLAVENESTFVLQMDNRMNNLPTMRLNLDFTFHFPLTFASPSWNFCKISPSIGPNFLKYSCMASIVAVFVNRFCGTNYCTLEINTSHITNRFSQSQIQITCHDFHKLTT